MLEITPGQRKSWQSVMPYLEDGAQFVFVPKVNGRGKVIHTLQLWLADGTVVPGKYSYSKRRLELLNKLTEGKLRRYRCWKLKK